MNASKIIITTFIFFFSYQKFFSGELQKLTIKYNTNSEVIFIIDHELHIKYGFLYPVTYKIDLPPNSSNLSAFVKYKKKGEWNTLTEKTSNDFFNGINAVRFDYSNNRAYLSAAFNSYSDTLFLKIVNDLGNNLVSNFIEICKYYDNRKAVVCATADDLNKWYNDGYKKAFHEFRIRNLWLSCGVVTQHTDLSTWQYIQQQLDSGFVEIDSHSQNHEWPYPDITSEVVGSRDDIVNYLDLPPFYNSGSKEYVYSYIYPFGSWTVAIDLASGNNGYFINRTVVSGQSSLTNWNDSFNMFNRVGVVYEVGPVYDGVSGISDINVLKNTFDNITNAGGIYHFSIHPNNIGSHGDWNLPYMKQHLDYISNRKDIWYVGFGTLYLYHYLQYGNPKPISSSINLKLLLEGAYSNSEQSFNLLINNLPHYQSYENAPWYYNGQENFNRIPNNDIVDWILISLKKNPDDTNYAARRAAFLKCDGTVSDIDGISPLRFNIESGNYYIIVNHRNHLPIMSSNPIHFE